MNLETEELRPQSIERRLPAARLLRCLGISIDVRKLILAALGLMMSWAGWYGLDQVFGSSLDGIKNPALALMSASTRGPELPWRENLTEVAEPFLVVVSPFLRAFELGTNPRSVLHAGCAALWGVVVWSLVGGAIARIAAVQQATGARIGIGTALRFAGSRAVALIGAPLCPMLAVGLFAGLCTPLALLYRLPGEIGSTIAGLLAFLPLMAGFVMALVLIGLAVGWPLMIATVAVEGEDVFDSLSRSYSYVFQRAGHYAIYGLLSWIVGAFGMILVDVFAQLVLHMTQWSMSIAGPGGRISSLFNGASSGDGLASSVHGFWVFLVRLLAHGWVYSYFFSVASMIYLLLRRDVDGASFDDIGGLDSGPDVFAPGPDAPTAD